MMGLSSILAKSQKDTVSDDQGSWRQYILDHLDYISRRSKLYEVDPPLMNLYRYDLKRFLKEYLYRKEDIAWITLLLNDYANDFDFVDVSQIIIPSDDLIKNLYINYVTITANAA